MAGGVGTERPFLAELAEAAVEGLLRVESSRRCDGLVEAILSVQAAPRPGTAKHEEQNQWL